MSPEHLLNPVQVRYAEDQHFIYVTINPREVIDGQLQAEQILDALLESGFSSFSYQIDQTVLDELIALPWHRLNRVIVRRIAWRVEFDLRVRFAEEQSQAFVTVLPSFAHEVIVRERLLERLSQAGVCQGLIESALEQILAEGQAEDLEIARARPPRHGRAGWLEWLFVPLHETVHPEVLPGTPLARVHPGQPGEDGFSLDGQVLKARHGQDENLQIGWGCGPDPEDPAVILALEKGVPLKGPGSISLMPLKQYAATEIHSGQYLHALEILGDLPANLRIDTLGHLIVRGSVSGGFLYAGGDMVITGAVQGPVRLVSAGDLCLTSAQEALLQVGGDLRVRDTLQHVRLYCGGQLRAAAARLAGGAYYLLQGGVCAELGALTSRSTQLALGPAAYFENRLRYLQAEQTALKSRLQSLVRRLVQRRSQVLPEPTDFVHQQNWLKGQQGVCLREYRALQLNAKAGAQTGVGLRVLKQLQPGCEALKDSGEMLLPVQSGPLLISREAQTYAVVAQTVPAVADSLPADHTE